MSNSQFKPAWWLPNPHLQTIWPAITRRDIKNLKLFRERLELPDGDFVDLDWVGKDEQGPLVIILHGLEGSIDSHYAKGMMQAVSNKGMRAVFMHFRGCSGEPNRLERGYHSGETEDFAYLVQKLHEREPDTILGAIGYSLGGNVLLKWLGETRQENPLKAAIAVSVPFELQKAAERIQEGFSRFYQWYFLKCLRDRLEEKYKQKSSSIDLSFLAEVQTMREFDNQLTAPLHGFVDADEYYNTASSRQYLRTIQIPTLIVHAKDDPFMTEDVIPQEYELSPYVKLEITDAGGHIGFVGGKYPWKSEYWLEERAPQFFVNYLF
jgi:uncharacterized protein